MKSPTVAAALNVIPLGFGYLYLGEDTRFGLTFAVGLILILLASFIMFNLAFATCGFSPCTGTEIALIFRPLALPLTLSIFTMIDAARRSKKSRLR
jgi:hypothetical protein